MNTQFYTVCLLCAGLTLAAPTVLFSQSVSVTTSLPPGIIDGATSPNLIPDAVAYRFVMLSLALPSQPSSADLIKQKLRLARLHLSEDDKGLFLGILASLTSDYAIWQDGLPFGRGTIVDRDNMMSTYRSRIEHSLSTEGVVSFQKYVQQEKTKMTVPR
jgi:hypothetical protein